MPGGLTVALVGRPNVGKSSLFNRLAGRRRALVHDGPGSTRDRRYGAMAGAGGGRVLLIDTGGLLPGAGAADGPLARAVGGEALRAASGAGLALLVMDCRAGVLPADLEIARLLREAGRPFLAVANKFDDPAAQGGSEHAFFAVGAGAPFAVSAEHGTGIGELRGEVARRAALGAPSPGAGEDAAWGDLPPPDGAEPPRIAITGLPNAGKSTLLNRLLGRERALASPVPGTTTDPVEAPGRMDLGGGRRAVVLIDTAGVRPRSRAGGGVEGPAAARALAAAAGSDAVVHLADAAKGLGRQDRRLLGLAMERGRPAVVALGKMDLLAARVPPGAARDRWLAGVRDSLPWAGFCDVVPVSARTGEGLPALRAALARVLRVAEPGTAALVRSLAGAAERAPLALPGPGGRRLRVRYASLVGASPPTVLVFSNGSRGIPPSYRRYLAAALRRDLGLGAGAPVRLVFRAGGASSPKGAPARPGPGAGRGRAPRRGRTAPSRGTGTGRA